MGLNSTPNGERLQIGIFGKTNAGKSSIINAITSQNTAIVSDITGTTTDPVYKSMELLPLGPVTIIDTPGLDDKSPLGTERIKKTYQVLNKTDIALLVTDIKSGLTQEDNKILDKIKEKNIPYIVVYNKLDTEVLKNNLNLSEYEIAVSSKTGENIETLKNKISKVIPEKSECRICADLIDPSDFVILITPIDSAAPKGRIILPQQQTIRDILDAGAVAVTAQEDKLSDILKNLSQKPKLVITDSQVFEKVKKDTPDDILLTSFSILFARYKGTLKTAVAGAKFLDKINDNSKILICEGCTHHRQCDDIGTVKLPKWIKKYTSSNPDFNFTSGTEFPDDLSKYDLIIHCGGCMLNEREVQHRYKTAQDQNIPITNYGIIIAYMNGILKRSLEPFPDIYSELEDL